MHLLGLLFLTSLCLHGSLQDDVEEQKTSNKTVKSTFRGTKVVPPGPSDLNTTGSQLLLFIPDSLPVLQLESNQTAQYLRSPMSTRLLPILYLLILAVGVPANLFTLCTLAFKVRKVSAAILYCSLALSDLLLLLSLVFKAQYHLRGNHWTLGETTCRLVSACFYGNLYCSAQTLACVSVNQYLAVVHPFLYKGLPKRACTACVTVVVWMVFGAGLVPELLVRQSYRIQNLEIITCYDVLPLGSSSHGFLLYYNLFLTVLGLLVPLVVCVMCYVRILVELKRSHSDWGRYIRSSALIFVIFLLCFTPAGVLHCAHYVQLFTDGTESLYMYFSVTMCLCCLHAAMDPFLFMLMSRSVGSNPYTQDVKSKTSSSST